LIFIIVSFLPEPLPDSLAWIPLFPRQGSLKTVDRKSNFTHEPILGMEHDKVKNTPVFIAFLSAFESEKFR